MASGCGLWNVMLSHGRACPFHGHKPGISHSGYELRPAVLYLHFLAIGHAQHLPDRVV